MFNTQGSCGSRVSSRLLITELVVWFLSLMFCSWYTRTRNFCSLHSFSLTFRSADWGHPQTPTCFSWSQSFVSLTVCFGSLSCWNCWNSRPGAIFSALAGTWPIHPPSGAAQMFCPLGRKTPTKHNVYSSMFTGRLTFFSSFSEY